MNKELKKLIIKCIDHGKKGFSFSEDSFYSYEWRLNKENYRLNFYISFFDIDSSINSDLRLYVDNRLMNEIKIDFKTGTYNRKEAQKLLNLIEVLNAECIN